MTQETIVAVYDTAAHADAVVRDLDAAGVPSDAISRTGGNSGTVTTGASPVREQGFWSGLFGGEPDHDTAVYDRSVESGSSILTVRAPAEHVAGVTAILERHNPIDIDERSNSYGLGRAAPRATPAMAPAPAEPTYGSGEVVIALSEEQIAVGKRLVDRGTTRVRRFVVEKPVEQQVTLHSEHVSIERHPVTGNVASTPDFSDRVIEVTETDEEAVVAKTAHVVEEVVVRKAATDRVETIHDTVRREDVEIGHDDAVATKPAATPVARPKI
ncbi:MAG: YsnF/AvaK domain-containing protein [Janthinobacterium lividum]